MGGFMNRHHVKLILTCLLVIGIFASPVLSQTYKSKLEYYNNVLVPTRGLKPLPTGIQGAFKPGSFLDRKQSILDVGNVIALISNGATLGYDRWGKCWEWPANSGFTYRWCMGPLMGGIINGQKSVASGTRGAARKSEEEFQPLPGYDAGYEDISQNIGIALSDIPEGWPSVWPTGQYEAPTGSRGFKGVSWTDGQEGEIVATREMYFVVTDDDPQDGNNPNPMHIRVDIWGLQWDDFINQDFIIFRMKVTNIGTQPIQDFFIGMHDDPDTPEQGSQEWTDDFAKFIPPGSDVENYSDAEDALLANFAYLWDGDDRVEGFMASNVPWVGLKVLETPEDPNNPGTQLGLTTLDVFEYSQAPQTEVGEYEQIIGASHVVSPDDTDGVMNPINVTPHPEDWTQTPNTYGPDITYVFASGPFQLNPGESIPFALASIHASNKSSLFLNAMRCQTLWNADLLASEAPPQPIVRAITGDKKVTLYWGNESELGIYQDGHIGDKQTGSTDKFQGYKVYKSIDRGKSWGTPITDINGGLMGYIPLAQYDLADGINHESTTRRYFQLGTDSGLKHYYIDQNVSNGFTYYYSVTAYDSDDGAVPPLENSIKQDPDRSDLDNTVSAVPQRPPTGVTMSAASNGVHTAGIADQEELDVLVVDEFAVTGHTYVVSFAEVAGTATFTITDQNTSAAVTDISGNVISQWEDFYDAETDNAVIFDGLRVEIPSIPYSMKDVIATGELYDGDDAGYWLYLYDEYSLFFGTTHDYQIVFTDEEYTIHSIRQVWNWYYDGAFSDTRPLSSTANFKVYDITEDPPVQIQACFYDRGGDGEYDFTDYIVIPPGITYGTAIEDFPIDDGLWVRFTYWGDGLPSTGDEVTVLTNKVYLADDKYTITTTGHSETNVEEAGLEDVQAVPNPFIVSSRFETGAYGMQKELQFHQLPEVCTIRIYNIAGDFIAELNHSGGSIEPWNLQSYNGQEVAFGLYFFHVKAPGVGEHIGKFAIIK